MANQNPRRNRPHRNPWGQFFFGTPQRALVTVIVSLVFLMILPIIVARIMQGVSAVVVGAMSIAIPFLALYVVYIVATGKHRGGKS